MDLTGSGSTTMGSKHPRVILILFYHMYFPGQTPAGLNYLQYTLEPANAAGTGHSTAETI